MANEFIAKNGLKIGLGSNQIAFPATRGADGQVMKVDANGQLYWAEDATSAAGITNILPASGSAVNASISSGVATLSFDASKVNLVDLAGNLPYARISGTPTLGTAASLNTGTSAGNIPVLDASGKLVDSVLPALAITDVNVVADNTARDALTVQKGDIAIVTGENKTYAYDGSAWQEIKAPTGAVSSVNGSTGAVTLANLTAGNGINALTYNGSSAATVSVNFAGTGSANTVSRSDHTHTKSQITDFPTLGTLAAKNSVDLSTSDVTGKLAVGSLSTTGTASSSNFLRGDGTWAAPTVSSIAWASVTGTPSTLSGYGITDAQPKDADLTAIAGLAGTSGLLKKTAADTWILDTNTYLTANQTITLSGDATGSGSTAITLTLANSGVTAGTYSKVTVNAKGLVTAGSAKIDVADINATGTPSSSTFLRGDGTWGTPAAGGGATGGYKEYTFSVSFSGLNPTGANFTIDPNMVSLDGFSSGTIPANTDGIEVNYPAAAGRPVSYYVEYTAATQTVNGNAYSTAYRTPTAAVFYVDATNKRFLIDNFTTTNVAAAGVTSCIVHMTFVS